MSTVLGSVLGSDLSASASFPVIPFSTPVPTLGFLGNYEGTLRDHFKWENSIQSSSFALMGASPLETAMDRTMFPNFRFTQVISVGGVVESIAQRKSIPDLPSIQSITHLFRVPARTWFDDLGSSTNDRNAFMPTVLATQPDRVPPRASKRLSSIAELQQEFWQCSPTSGTETQTKVSDGRFYVWLKGCQVAEFPTRAAAEKFSATLSQALKAPDVDFSQLKPTFVRDNPAGRLGNKTLFIITPELAQALNQTPELLAIEWINHLRVALGQAELELSQAQAQMYGLEDTDNRIDGVASWYGPYFHGRITATGEVYNQYDLTAASRTLPFDTYLRVTNRKNGKQVIVRINDRGPYVDEHLRVLDLSYRAATCLGSDETGIVPIDAVILKPAPGSNLRIGQKVAGVNL